MAFVPTPRSRRRIANACRSAYEELFVIGKPLSLARLQKISTTP